MYDFMVYGYYATFIAKAFFPTGNEFSSLMLSLATFGAGYLMRPIGALVLGAYADRHGRRKGLILTLALMSFGTLSIACLPGYATLGLLAPLLILIGRLVQGFSAGMELGGVSVYLAEIATPGHRGFYTAWQSGSQQVAVVFAAVLGVVVSLRLTSQQMSAWGWRLPLIAGCAIIPFLFVIRRTLPETEEFLAQKHHPGIREIVTSLGVNWKLVVSGMLLSTMTTVTFYMITAYTPTFGQNALHLASLDNFIVTMCVGFSNLFWLPAMGSVSDRVGRRPLLICFALLSLITAYPALLWLVSAPSFMRLLMVELWLSFLFGGYNGAAMPFLAEVMPAKIRAAGFSLAFSLATAVFGGFTPAICTWLIHVTGNRAVPGLWLSFAAVMGLAAVGFTRKRGAGFSL
jgi:MFS family permease